MLKNLTSLQQRIITGIILLFLVFLIVPASQTFFAFALFVLALLGLWEMFSLFSIPKNPFTILPTVFATALSFALAATVNAYFILAGFLVFILLIFLLFLLLWGVFYVELPFEKYAFILFALLYVVTPLQIALLLTPTERFFVLLITSISDIGAFVGGNYLGKHPIWPRVSPKKTVEGALVGMGLCILSVLLYTHFFLPQYPFFTALWIALLLNIASQLGDFFESALKRIHHVKDSSSILPGHGGILDRIDSLLFVLPTYYIIKICFFALS